MLFISNFLSSSITKKQKRNIDAAVFSNVGNIRSNHEDNYLLGFNNYISASQQRKMVNSYITSSCVFEGKEGVFAVCDGMGGHAAGEVASRMAVNWLNDKYSSLLTAKQEQIEQYVALINQDICTYANTHYECKNMGSTLAALLVTNKEIYCFHAGDSRVYEISSDQMYRLTSDHTEGQRLLDWKFINEKELQDLKTRKNLYRYLGYPGELVSSVKKIEKKEAYYLLCSDGVTDILDDNILEKIFKENRGCIQIGEKILERTLGMKDKCTDNVTAMVVHIT